MSPKLPDFFHKVIFFSFQALFFVTPFLVSIQSTELFEFPKMLFVYALTIGVTAAWLAHIIVTGHWTWRKSWLDIPLGLILLTQVLSTWFSIHPYTSWYGYYSRFHGGFLSTLCYAILTWAFIQFGSKDWIKQGLLASLASASLVSLYGVAEHFGIDAHLWVQDVQNRVFSTLGQPNWLSAWLLALLPFSMAWYLKPPKSAWPLRIGLNLIVTIIAYGVTVALTKDTLPISGGSGLLLLSLIFLSNGFLATITNSWYERFFWLTSLSLLSLNGLFVATILYTKSRSGILALILGIMVFGIGWMMENSRLQITDFKSKHNNHSKKSAVFNLQSVISYRRFLILNSLFLILILLLGTEYTPSLGEMTNNQSSITKKVERLFTRPTTNDPLSTSLPHPESVSESTDIRRVVWQGGVELWKKYPLLGSGAETFAYAYYQVRPQHHNDLSEWDFLYNKAHNEYVNYLSNTGTLGTTAIFLYIVLTIWMCVRYRWKAWLTGMGVLGLGLSLLYLFTPTFLLRMVDKLLIYPPLLWPIGICLGLAMVLAGIVMWLYREQGLEKKSEIRISNSETNSKNKFQNSKRNNIETREQSKHGLSLPPDPSLAPALLASLTTIVVTNFYGFSVVNVAVFFFLLPAFWIVTHSTWSETSRRLFPSAFSVQALQPIHWVALGMIGVCVLVLETQVIHYFQADSVYNLSKAFLKEGSILEANQSIDKALDLRPFESEYYLQKASVTSQAAYLVSSQMATQSGEVVEGLEKQSDQYTQEALRLNPVHLNLYKNAARIYLTLALIKPDFFEPALKTLEQAALLAPTDPQPIFNIALIYQQLGRIAEAETYFKKTVDLKPNYRRAWLLMAQFYQDEKQLEKAKAAYEFVLKNIDPKDETSLREIQKIVADK